MFHSTANITDFRGRENQGGFHQTSKTARPSAVHFIGLGQYSHETLKSHLFHCLLIPGHNLGTEQNTIAHTEFSISKYLILRSSSYFFPFSCSNFFFLDPKTDAVVFSLYCRSSYIIIKRTERGARIASLTKLFSFQASGNFGRCFSLETRTCISSKVGWFPTSAWNAVWKSGTASPVHRESHLNILETSAKKKRQKT